MFTARSRIQAYLITCRPAFLSLADFICRHGGVISAIMMIYISVIFLSLGGPWITEPPSPSHTYHSSATAFPQDIRNYIKNEIFYGSIAGPFPQPPFTPWFQTNPLMSRPKKDSIDRRVILDLSWPLDFSVNDGIDKLTYLGNPYKLYLQCVDDLINLVIKHGPGCYLYSRDMARAYRQLRCDPAD